jgi:glycosyltransferase involved in cell wall biosynthesis
MKVLVSAVACTPYHGSENYVGWEAVKALSKDHGLWVLTSRRNVPDLQRATAEGLVPDNVHFAFAGTCSPWHPNRMRARLQGWREYLNFSKAILPVARQLLYQEKFDVVHHVTYVTWRVASPLGELGIPFVFGPVGGYEQFPLRLLPTLSPAATAFELARMTSNVISRFSPAVRHCLRSADHVVVGNLETEKLVKTVRGASAGVSTLSAAFYSSTQIESFSRFAEGKHLSGPLRLFAAGNMEGRKGVALALEALAEAKQKGVQFQYRLGASGPEVAHLKQLTSRLGLQDHVIFGDSLHGEAYRRELGDTHIFLLPSLRESAGLTMMEAMLAGAVPVVADCGGPASIVTNDSGYKIPITSSHQMVQEMAEILVAMDRNRQLIAEKGRAASARIATHFSEDNYRQTIKGIYQAVTARFEQGRESQKIDVAQTSIRGKR